MEDGLPKVTVTAIAPWLLPVPLEEVSRLAREMLQKSLSSLPGGLEISFLRDGDIWLANKEWLGCDGPTNVLAFPPSGPDESGSLLISVDTLRRECLLYGQDATGYLVRLLAHGLAHVLGYDHGPEMDEVCAGFIETRSQQNERNE